MGKPKAPAAPDYVGAANAQGIANTDSAIASNMLNQANQVGPYGSLSYSYSQPGSGKGYYTSQGQYVPEVTATTTLDAAQQKLLDQNNQISIDLNDLATKGIGYVGEASANPIDQSKLPSLNTGLALENGTALRDKITSGYMERLQPLLDRDSRSLDTQLANQGIQVGSEAYSAARDDLNRGQNDQRIAALLAGDQEQQAEFSRGLATSQFGNQARSQAIQEADYFKNQPLNMLNALRTGNQTTTPTFGNVTAGNSIQAAPIYQATADQYQSALDRYKIQSQNSGGLLSGLTSLGSAAIMASDRRLKTGICKIGELANGLAVYTYRYIWGGPQQTGVMADEVARIKPEALGPTILGYQTVNYGAL